MTVKNVSDIRILFDIDTFVWGDLEDLESRSPTAMRKVIQKNVDIPGYDTPETKAEYLRGLKLSEMNELAAHVFNAMQDILNPKDETGKN